MFPLMKRSPNKALLLRINDSGFRVYKLHRYRNAAATSALCVLLLWSLYNNVQAWAALEPRQTTAEDQSSPARQHPRPDLKNLILVACHAVFIGPDYTKAEDPESWLLLDYQKVPGQAHSFIEHIQEGIAQAEADEAALVLFSGGQTRKAAGPRSEAEGYWLVAEAANWWGHSLIRDRAFAEEHARDSFENLLFSLCRFYELTGHYPDNVLVISYDFKHERFTDLHRAALHWPDHRFRFLGTPALVPSAAEAEHRVLQAFRQDPFGCSGSLMSKKRDRDPFAVGPYSSDRCTELEPILHHCEDAQPQTYLDVATLVPWEILQ